MLFIKSPVTGIDGVGGGGYEEVNKGEGMERGELDIG